jgi:hypothetical protein
MKLENLQEEQLWDCGLRRRCGSSDLEGCCDIGGLLLLGRRERCQVFVIVDRAPARAVALRLARARSTIRSWGDALWWSLTTLTTVGYGDHVPVTTTGRLIAAGVMVAGVAVIGAVAAIVALAVALRVAREEELAFEAAAEILEQRLDVRLARIEAQLAGLDARLQAWPAVSVDDAVRSGGGDQ